MKTTIPPKEWEALSAYLDGQLTPKDRARLETRLKADTDLRSALDDLDRTRALIRRQSKLRAPRNFTLTSEMAGLRSGVRSSQGAYPILRLASALATIFFIVVFFGNLLTQSSQPTTLLAVPSGQTEAPAPAPMLGMGGGGGGGGGPVQNFALPIAPTEAPAATLEAAPMAKLAGNETPLAESLMVTPLAAMAETPTPEGIPQSLADQNAREPAPQVGVAPANPEASQAQPLLTTQAALGALEVLLAILAIVTGVAAVLLRRSTHG